MNLSMFSLADKVAIVTGSGRGIGKAIALGFADAGANVVVCARTAADLETTVAEINARGRKALAVPTDMRESAQVANLVQKALDTFGTIDILVNNAGAAFGGPTLELSERAWESLLRENLKSVFLCIQAVGKVMATKKKGAIINISSTLGQSPAPNMVGYGAAKAAIISLTRSLAVEWAPHNIRVNAIAPGLIETPGTTAHYSQRPEAKKVLIAMVPLGRIGQPQDIVGAAIYFASDASSYVTGEVLAVSGGAASQSEPV